MKKLAAVAMVALALMLGGCANFLTPQERESLADLVWNIEVSIQSAQASAQELVVIGDLSAEDAAWIDEHASRLLPMIAAARKIAEGSLTGDVVAQLDLVIDVLREARQHAPSPSTAEMIGRVTAVAVFYRASVEAEKRRAEGG